MEQEQQELLNKFNIIASISKLGSDAFAKKDIEKLGIHIVNNSRGLFNYHRAGFVDFREKEPKIIAVSGIDAADQFSEYSVNLRNLIAPYKKIKEPIVLSEDNISAKNAEAYKYFQDNCGLKILVTPINPPHINQTGETFLLVLEYKDEYNPMVFQLLIARYAEALWYQIYSKKSLWDKIKNNILKITPLKIAVVVLIAVIASLFIINVDEAALGELELIPIKRSYHFSPYNAIIDKVKYKNGVDITKGKEILSFVTDDQEFALASSNIGLAEIDAQLDLVRQTSFFDKEKLAEIPLLEIRKKKLKVEKQQAEWYINQSIIFAKMDGTLLIDDKENLEGKSVNAGVPLFEIISEKELEAEIFIEEQKSSILRDLKKITIHLHSLPDEIINGEIIYISPKPVLSPTNQFCYKIKFKLTKQKSIYTCGMRGVAKVYGKKVKLGYYLFKNIILWWKTI